KQESPEFLAYRCLRFEPIQHICRSCPLSFTTLAGALVARRKNCGLLGLRRLLMSFGAGIGRGQVANEI
ncbi:MAG: hypothetical protein VW935_13640, partial [Novosphingobium sp.]